MSLGFGEEYTGNARWGDSKGDKRWECLRLQSTPNGCYSCERV